MDANPAEALKDRLRFDLKAAMRGGEKFKVSALRDLIAELDNAEAVEVGADHDKFVLHDFGDRSAEAPRRLLSQSDVQAILAREEAERTAAALEMERLGLEDRAARLRAAASLISTYRD